MKQVALTAQTMGSLLQHLFFFPSSSVLAVAVIPIQKKGAFQACVMLNLLRSLKHHTGTRRCHIIPRYIYLDTRMCLVMRYKYLGYRWGKSGFAICARSTLIVMLVDAMMFVRMYLRMYLNMYIVHRAFIL